MSDRKDKVQNSDDYIWIWAEPEPIDRTSLIILNENLISSMGLERSIFPIFEGEASEKLNQFVTTFYQNEIFEVGDLDLLAQNLFLLRSIDMQMREVKRLVKRDEMVNAAQIVLLDLIPLINENPYLLSEMNRRLR